MSSNNEYFRENRFLGMEIAKYDKIFKETACMRRKERLEYVNVEIIKILMGDTIPKGMLKWLNFIQKVISLRGQASWERNELTHLSAKAQQNPHRKPKKLGKMPDNLTALLTLDGFDKIE